MRLASSLIGTLALSFSTVSLATENCPSGIDLIGLDPGTFATNCFAAAKQHSDQAAVKAASSPAFALDNFGGAAQMFTHPHNNLPSAANVSALPGGSTILAMESNTNGTTLYGLDDFAKTLVIINPNTGAVSTVGPAVPKAGHGWTGLAIGPDGSFAFSTNIVESTLYSINLNTGSVTEIGSQSDAPGIIDAALTCNGEMYAHDIINDSMYAVDYSDGSVSLIGATGIDANFAQGMTVDRDTGTVYVHGYTGSGTNTYGTLNKATGAIDVLSVNAISAEFEGATTTSCLPPARVDSSSATSLAGLAALISILAAIGMRRRIRNHG